MPNRDGTGPSGMGPGTGRGWGRCFFGSKRKGFSKASFIGAIVPLIGAVIKGLMNPYGMSRTLLRKLQERSKISQKTNDGKNREVKADYKIINETISEKRKDS